MKKTYEKKKHTSHVFGLLNNALEGGEDEPAIDEVIDEAVHGRPPGLLLHLLLLPIIGFNRVGAEPHGHEPHLLDDPAALAGVLLAVPLALLDDGRGRGEGGRGGGVGAGGRWGAAAGEEAVAKRRKGKVRAWGSREMERHLVFFPLQSLSLLFLLVKRALVYPVIDIKDSTGLPA